MDDFQLIRTNNTKDGIPFLLRPATPDDSDVIIKNINEICDEQVFLYTDKFIMTPEWTELLKKSVDEEKGNLLIVAQVDDLVVGHLRMYPLWYGVKTRHVGEVGLAIIKEWRERSLGTSMLNYALEWASIAGFKKITASVIATNQRALKLFNKFHFKNEGLRVQQFIIHGTYTDEILMARFLDN